MKHTARGYWIEEAGQSPTLRSLHGDLDADVVILGGGYTGMWTAWHLLELEPAVRIAIIEAERIGNGPSGRNGGFASDMWLSMATLRNRHGAAGALGVARAASDAVTAIESFCAEQGVDAWFRRAGMMEVSAAPAQDAVWSPAGDACRELGEPGACIELSEADVAERCRSPRFRAGVLVPTSATVQPARLALGLGSRLLARGVRIFENSRARRVHSGTDGVEVRTEGGRVRARSAVLATGGALAGRGSPLHRHLTVTSSHIVLTEPVPEILEEIGWTGGEAITDSRSMVHYMRTTPDGRIAFGWGGGRLAAGGRLHGRIELDPEVVREVGAHLRSFFPQLEGRRITHAWGGPIDVSPTHLPAVVELSGGRAFAAFGFTGNGVAPSNMVGRILASLALDRRDEHTRLAIVESSPKQVPPEPLRWTGGVAIRRALRHKEAAEEEGRRAGPVSRAVAKVPRLVGFHIGR